MRAQAYGTLARLYGSPIRAQPAGSLFLSFSFSSILARAAGLASISRFPIRAVRAALACYASSLSFSLSSFFVASAFSFIFALRSVSRYN